MKILVLANDDRGLYLFRRELLQTLLQTNQVMAALPYGDCIQDLKKMGCQFYPVILDRRSRNLCKDLWLLYQYNRILKQYKPDLVLTYTIKPNIYGGLLCGGRRLPYAANVTGLGTAFQGNRLLRRLAVYLYRIGLKRAQTVFFENEDNMKTFLEEGIVRREQVCRLNGAGVNLDRFQVLEYPSDMTETRFLFMGRVMKEKGIDELLGAMGKLRRSGISCSLDVIGYCEEDYEGLIEQYEKEGWLHYHGFQKNVTPFIKACHCFVLPSWHEGMANANLECAASGRPVITSRIHGCLEAVEDGTSGFLCGKQDMDDLYDKMAKFTMLSFEERRAMGLAGRRRMEIFFDRRVVVRETISRL